MKKAPTDYDWLNAVASTAGVRPARVQSIMAARGIALSPVAASPRRLLLKHISFAGTKDGVVSSGPFEFSWPDLACGLWAMTTETNLKGKSSVIEIVRWMLRGRASSNLQEDVRRWIDRATLRFQLDDTAYEVRLTTKPQLAGDLFRCEKDSEKSMATFVGDTGFEDVMSSFFMREFSLDAVANWGRGTAEDEGKLILHKWPALSGVMFVGTDYSALLGDLPAVTGVPIRLMQMYLGLPWISTQAAAKSVQQSLANEHLIKTKRNAAAADARTQRAEVILAELTGKQLELERSPSDGDLRPALFRLRHDFSQAVLAEQQAEQRLRFESDGVEQLEIAYAHARHEFIAHCDAQAAGTIFRRLNPSCCPRCDIEVTDERRKRESADKSCSLCGESVSSNADAVQKRTELEQTAQACKALLDKSQAAKDLATKALDEAKASTASIDIAISAMAPKMSQSASRAALELDIAILKARLAEAQFDSSGIKSNDDEPSIINAIITESEARFKGLQAELLSDVSAKIVVFAKRFGMSALSDAHLKGNLNLFLTKGGQDTSYSKVTDGEKLRLKIAAVLAMISVAEARGLGRHPGLLLIDSPGAQEVSPKDLEELIAGLEETSKEFKHLQVFVASLATPAIAAHVPLSRRRHAPGDTSLW